MRTALCRRGGEGAAGVTSMFSVALLLAAACSYSLRLLHTGGGRQPGVLVRIAPKARGMAHERGQVSIASYRRASRPGRGVVSRYPDPLVLFAPIYTRAGRRRDAFVCWTATRTLSQTRTGVWNFCSRWGTQNRPPDDRRGRAYTLTRVRARASTCVGCSPRWGGGTGQEIRSYTTAGPAGPCRGGHLTHHHHYHHRTGLPRKGGEDMPANAAIDRARHKLRIHLGWWFLVDCVNLLNRRSRGSCHPSSFALPPRGP